MSERQTFLLSNREKRASVAQMVANLELGTLVEIKGARRSDEQNDAIHGLIAQILKQRPHHFGMRMSMEAYKGVFMHALGRETPMLPTLDGDGFFPMGLRTSKLLVSEASQLIEFILAWCAREGLEILHFDADDRGASASRRERAA